MRYCCLLALIILLFALSFHEIEANNNPSSYLNSSDQLLNRDTPDTMCGPHCLWQVAYTYGLDYSLGAIRNMCGTRADKGTSIVKMVETARTMGLYAEGVETTQSYLQECPYIKVLLLDYEKLDHYVILDKIENEQALILDGGTYTNISCEQLSSLWRGYAILISNEPILLPTSTSSTIYGVTIQFIGACIICVTIYLLFRSFRNRKHILL